MEGANVGVVDGRNRAPLLFEAAGEFFIADLDGNRAAQTGVRGAEHLAHAALAQGRLDLVGAQPRAGRQLARENGVQLRGGLIEPPGIFGLRRRDQRRLRQKPLQPVMLFEQRFDHAAQRRLALTGAAQKRPPLVALQFESFSEKLFRRLLQAVHQACPVAGLSRCAVGVVPTIARRVRA